ncbi:MAG: Rpn family recombination-promoting nuclease/putative transposase [Bacteroidales bacterium]|nr:Rpn family recombination-promoting nuclease/putative transposase [Bacteroidales bacterium]
MTQKRFISPLTDFGFKRIFGNKDILLAFLNDLFEGEVQFIDLVYSDKEIKGDSGTAKTVIYDIHCTTSSGERIIVEMQNEFTLGFRDRMVYYIARDVAKQGEAGKDWNYVNLKAVYSIIFTNFELFDNDGLQESFQRHDVKLVDTATNRPFTDKIRMVCLQIPLTVEEPLQVGTKIDTWMYNLKNMERMQQLTNTEDMPIFKRLEQVAEYHQLSPEDREAYDISYKHYLDAYNLELSRKRRMEMAIEQGLQQGIEQGLQQGIEQGRAEGEREKQFEIAKSFKSLGIDTDTIVQGTGLSPEEVEAL